MRLFGDNKNPGMSFAVASVVLGALTLSGCPTRSAATDVDGEGEVAPDASTAKADAGSGAAGGMAMPGEWRIFGRRHAAIGRRRAFRGRRDQPAATESDLYGLGPVSERVLRRRCLLRHRVRRGVRELARRPARPASAPRSRTAPTTPARAARPATPRVPAAKISAGAARRRPSARPAAASTVSAARPPRARRARRARSPASRESARPSPGSSTTESAPERTAATGRASAAARTAAPAPRRVTACH